jgi:protein SCO1/2
MKYSRFLCIALFLWLTVTGHASAGSFQGVRVEPPRTIHPLTLLDQESRVTHFPLQQQGWQLVVFGYTHCPDVCPMTLHKTAQLLTELGEDSARVRIVFISIDSTRDDVRAMKEFVEKFDQRIVGLTGDPESLQAAANAFDVLTRRYQGKTALAYTLVHSSLLYLLDPEGRVRMMYPGGTGIDGMAADLRRLWQESGSSVSGIRAATR